MAKYLTTRFSDRVETLVRYRPGYPAEVLDLLRAECGLQPDHIVADIASGTGVFTRLLLENGNSVFAVEPNAEMRERGAHELEHYPRLEFGRGNGGRDDAAIGFGGLCNGGPTRIHTVPLNRTGGESDGCTSTTAMSHPFSFHF